MSESEQIDRTKIPVHIAVIMDGNGRWAEERGQDRLFGHLHGVDSVREVAECAAEIGVKYLTLYAFSTENWDRPKYEVDGLMELLVDTIKKEVPTLNKNNIRLRVIGDIAKIPPLAAKELQEALQDTAANSGMQLVMALSYSSKWELIDAMKKMAQDVSEKKLEPVQISETVFRTYLATSDMPDPELMIRTSGEHRISNFLLYQLAYAELYFTNVLWPDFRKQHLMQAISDYQKRERRFGKTGNQIKDSNIYS